MQDGKKLIEYVKSLKWRVRAINIIGIEDFDYKTWEPLPNAIDVFNDTVVIVKNTGQILSSLQATTESSQRWTDRPMNPKGAARIKLGIQFRDAWIIGNHKNQYPALVQDRPIKVLRDKNKSGTRTADMEDEGLFGINIHTTSSSRYGIVPQTVGAWSAGCTVIRSPMDFYLNFMPWVINSGMKTIDYGVLDGDAFDRFRREKSQ